MSTAPTAPDAAHPQSTGEDSLGAVRLRLERGVAGAMVISPTARSALLGRARQTVTDTLCGTVLTVVSDLDERDGVDEITVLSRLLATSGYRAEHLYTLVRRAPQPPSPTVVSAYLNELDHLRRAVALVEGVSVDG